MPRFSSRHTVTKSQHNERRARKNRRPGGKCQPKGTPPAEYRPVEKAAFVPIPTRESGVRVILGSVGRKLHLLQRQSVPDLRCPQCDSSRMGKEGLNTCPECGYEGEPVDVSGKAREVEGAHDAK